MTSGALARSTGQAKDTWIWSLLPAVMFEMVQHVSFLIVSFGCFSSWSRLVRMLQFSTTWVCRSSPVTMFPIDRSAGVTTPGFGWLRADVGKEPDRGTFVDRQHSNGPHLFLQAEHLFLPRTTQNTTKQTATCRHVCEGSRGRGRAHEGRAAKRSRKGGGERGGEPRGRATYTSSSTSRRHTPAWMTAAIFSLSPSDRYDSAQPGAGKWP